MHITATVLLPLWRERLFFRYTSPRSITLIHFIQISLTHLCFFSNYSKCVCTNLRKSRSSHNFFLLFVVGAGYVPVSPGELFWLRRFLFSSSQLHFHYILIKWNTNMKALKSFLMLLTWCRVSKRCHNCCKMNILLNTELNVAATQGEDGWGQRICWPRCITPCPYDFPDFFFFFTQQWLQGSCFPLITLSCFTQM